MAAPLSAPLNLKLRVIFSKGDNLINKCIFKLPHFSKPVMFNGVWPRFIPLYPVLLFCFYQHHLPGSVKMPAAR